MQKSLFKLKGGHTMKRVFVLISLVALSACAPAVQAPNQPYLFSTDYDTLFDATLQTLASARVSSYTGRAGFAIDEADRTTGLITAVRLGRSRVTGAGTLGEGLGFGFRSGSMSVRFSSSALQTDRTLLSVVVRPAGAGAASLVYSSTASSAADVRIADAFMAEVVQGLLARFGTAVEQ